VGFTVPSVFDSVNSTVLVLFQIHQQDHFERKNGGGFNAQELQEHPECYVSNFAHKFAPYASVIINGIFWAPNTPRSQL
jgi:alpha-aminoadipic semialdehyde synthase